MKFFDAISQMMKGKRVVSCQGYIYRHSCVVDDWSPGDIKTKESILMLCGDEWEVDGWNLESDEINGEWGVIDEDH